MQGIASVSVQPHTPIMPKARKVKHRAPHVVTYVRVKPEEHARITEIAEKRGYPHTIASVAAEMISRGLKDEASAPPTEALA